jgi:hypothetical protein
MRAGYAFVSVQTEHLPSLSRLSVSVASYTAPFLLANSIKNMLLRLLHHSSDDQWALGRYSVKVRSTLGLGQTCVCANRLYVQSVVAEEFSRRFVKEVEEFKCGPNLDGISP